MTFLAPYPVTEKVDALERCTLKAIFGASVYFYFVYIYFYLLSFLCNGSFHDKGEGIVSTLFPSSIDWGNMKENYNLSNTIVRVIVDLVMLSFWAIHHSLFARGPVKRFQIEILGLPADLERSVYVLSATVMVHIIFSFWQPIDERIWGDENASNWAYVGVVVGWLLTFVSTFMIDHFDLFGLRQTTHLYTNSGTIQEKLLYKWIRHPLMTGFFIQWWARPYMTAASLIWGLATTGYILLANMVEERDLAIMDPEYAGYRKRTTAYIPMCPMWNPLMSSFKRGVQSEVL